MLGMYKNKLIIILFLIFSAFIIYYSNHKEDNSKAIIWSNKEKEFFRPIDIVWRGEIISIMANGSCIGLEGEFDNYSKAIACFEDMDSKELLEFEGMITVTGKWFGITCAYENTVFGECVPDVRIENIEI